MVRHVDPNFESVRAKFPCGIQIHLIMTDPVFPHMVILGVETPDLILQT